MSLRYPNSLKANHAFKDVGGDFGVDTHAARFDDARLAGAQQADDVAAAIAAADATPFWGYDFATDGGVAGTIVLLGPTIPNHAFVNACFLEVITPFDSAGLATVALTTGETAADIEAALAFGNAAYTAGMHVIAVHKLMTGTRAPAIVIAVADLIAGKIKLSLDIMEGWG